MVHHSVSEKFRADAAPLAGQALASTMAAPCTAAPTRQRRTGEVGSLTADLWLLLLQAPPAIVLVASDPLQIARSVNARDKLPLPYCLALWERYL